MEADDERTTAWLGRDPDAIRRTVMAAALETFAAHGFAGPTLDDIAHHARVPIETVRALFPSKDSIVLTYHVGRVADLEALASAATGSIGERLAHVMHAQVDALWFDRAWMRELTVRLVDPSDPLSVFADSHRPLIERGTVAFERLLATAVDPSEVRPIASALRMVLVSFHLLYFHDDSPRATATLALLDDFLDTMVPALSRLATVEGRAELAATPVGKRYFALVSEALQRGGIRPR